MVEFDSIFDDVPGTVFFILGVAAARASTPASGGGGWSGNPTTIYKIDLDTVVGHGTCVLPAIVTQCVEFLRENGGIFVIGTVSFYSECMSFR